MPASQEEDVLVVVLLVVLLVVALEGKGEEEEVRLKCALHAAMIAIKHDDSPTGIGGLVYGDPIREVLAR